MGFAINDAQNGDEHPRAKALKCFGGRSVLEVVADEDGDTYRAVYTVRFCRSDLCPSCLPKEVKEGDRNEREIEIIKARLKVAEAHYRENYGKGATSEQQ